MKNNKIDKSLLTLVEALSEEKQIECIVKALDYRKLRDFLRGRQIEVLREYLFINSFQIRLNKNELSALSQFAQVEYIYSISSACALMNVSKKILNVESSSLSGRGVNIAFIDTGVKPHLDFLIGENRIFFKDFIGGKDTPYDDNGHGTFVTGVCAGNGVLSGGRYSGIAPRAGVVSLKALDSSGEASADKILNAMEWIYNNCRQYEIKIVCMSFGSEPLGYNDPIMSGADALWRSGVTVVAAAGNSGPEYQTIKSPGVSSKIITVGGFDDNRVSDDEFNSAYFEVADFSSRGPAFSRYKPDLVAPSVDIISCGIKKPYCSLSGTSVATPMIAGLAALVLEAEPKLRPDEVKRRLISRAKAISFNRNLEGFGYPVF